ncbi:glycosyltransferase [Tunicatimonas pelagia]|uniref:glycosyltransferase n=1 Tax=Tunicatimonas pelagia TaxID=931531 RepID=UPI0026668ABA|nr:glycosyltransferase [Tunicatimonas pelagia]WKN41200.1 glycosyltransferase [Tunicatimonas pelagia]
MFYSLIIPVYNRPEDIREVLEGLVQQTYSNFEVIVVESGSTIKSDQVVADFQNHLNVRYAPTGNHGQGFSRNFGMEQAQGDYFIILDSDIIVPSEYLQHVHEGIQQQQLDAFGGPDRGHASFTPVQKAVDFALTSFLTTAGTRGQKKQVGEYHPRSFNMGFSREVYEATGGYRLPNCGEDIDLSIRIHQQGFTVGLIPKAFIYHKRKRTLAGFWQQMVWFGKSRINLARLFPGSLKPIYFLPLAFYAYLILTLLLVIAIPLLGKWLLAMLGFYAIAVVIEGALRYKSLRVGILSIFTAFTVFLGYGYGLVKYYFQQSEPYTHPAEAL